MVGGATVSSLSGPAARDGRLRGPPTWGPASWEVEAGPLGWDLSFGSGGQLSAAVEANARGEHQHENAAEARAHRGRGPVEAVLGWVGDVDGSGWNLVDLHLRGARRADAAVHRLGSGVAKTRTIGKLDGVRERLVAGRDDDCMIRCSTVDGPVQRRMHSLIRYSAGRRDERPGLRGRRRERQHCDGQNGGRNDTGHTKHLALLLRNEQMITRPCVRVSSSLPDRLFGGCQARLLDVFAPRRSPSGYVPASCICAWASDAH